MKLHYHGIQPPKGLNTAEEIVSAEINRRQSNRGMSGFTTGLPMLDKATSGWSSGAMHIICARPSEGKTSLAIYNMLALSGAGIHSAYVGLESPIKNTNMRIAGYRSGLSVNEISNLQERDEVTKKAFWRSLKEMDKLPMSIVDAPGMKPADCAGWLRKLATEDKAKVIFIDHFHNLTRGMDEGKMGEVSSGLMNTARELDVALVVLAQKNRAVLHREAAYFPSMGDLRGSGALEEDAHTIVDLNRPDLNRQVKYGDEASSDRSAHLAVIKAKDGVAGARVICSFIDGRFSPEPPDNRNVGSLPSVD